MDTKRVHELVDKNFDEMVGSLSDLIRVPSVLDESERSEEHPFGPRVTEALEIFLSVSNGLGFRVSNVGNMAGYAEIGEGPLFGVLAHLDVMPPGSLTNWKTPPFEPVILDGTLYGRGAIDDKGPAVSALYALKALADSGVKLNRRFRLIAGLDEESGFRCIERYKETEEIPEACFSPDSCFPVVNGEKGILHFVMSKKINRMDAMGLPELADIRGGSRFNIVPDELRVFFKNASPGSLEVTLMPLTGAMVENAGNGVLVTVRGVSAHAMEPWMGENAVQKFLSAVESLDFGPPELHAELIKLWSVFRKDTKGESLGIASSDDVSGPLSCNLSAVSLDGGVLSVKCDIRYPVKVTGDFVIGGLRNAARSMGWELDIKRHTEPLYVSPESDLVSVLLDAYEAVTCVRGEPISIGGGTYCNALSNSVSYGALFPGEVDTAHQPNEYVSLDSLRRMTHIYAEAAARLNGE